jgi:hypothetical protein
MPLEKKRDVIATVLNGETLILDVQGNRIHHLNVTASHVWHEYSDQGSSQQIAETMASVFNIDLDTAKHDVERILKELHALGLFIKTAPSEDGSES